MDERTLGRAALLEQAARAFGSQPEHLWARTPTYAILRKAGSGKWYAAFMDLPRRTPGLPGEGGHRGGEPEVRPADDRLAAEPPGLSARLSHEQNRVDQRPFGRQPAL